MIQCPNLSPKMPMLQPIDYYETPWFNELD